MKLYPNASVLILITQSSDKSEKLLFIYTRPVPDIYPNDKVHWYDGAGKNGKANNVWENLSIKQWAVCGKDEIVSQLFDEVISTSRIIIDDKEISLTIAPYQVIADNSNIFKGREEVKSERFKTDVNTLIPQAFYQKENLNFLTSVKAGSKEIKPIFPLGFFETNFIYDNLKENTWGIKEYRTAFLTFHGVRATSQKGIGSKEIVGFYQQKFDRDLGYQVVVRNELQKEIGRAPINKGTGFFKVDLTEPTQAGIVEVLAGSKDEKSIDYVLIQDIKIEGQIANNTYKDTYGRSFLITKKEKVRPTSLANFTWQRNVYSDTSEADQKLSDLFKSVIDFLGPRILIVDPYFIGNINQDKVTTAISYTHCQAALINALIHSAVEKGIEQINILGYWGRAKAQVEGDEGSELSKKEYLFQTYQKALKNLITENKLEKYFPPSTIRFFNAKEDFHNRYWCSLTASEGYETIDKCVILTNSIGNIHEIDIVPIPVSEQSQQLQITRKYSSLYKSSELKLTI